MAQNLSRRNFLKGLALGAGGIAGARLGGAGWLGEARADGTEKPALLIVYLTGGYNALFPSADSFLTQNSFGVSSGNVLDLGNGLVVDNTFASMPEFAQGHMASIGVNHGVSDHGAADAAVWSDGNRNYALRLAAAMGGDGATKAAAVGGRMPEAPLKAEGGVTLQAVRDVASTLAAVGGTDPNLPNRAIAAKGLASAQAMSKNRFAQNPKSLVSVQDAFGPGIASLQKPVQSINYGEIAQAYGISASATTVTTDLRTQMAAAEVMIQAGANVVTAVDTFEWDDHGDLDGSGQRNRLSSRTLPALNTFLSRMLNTPNRNVVVAMFGEFSRSLPGADHQPNLTATVLGKYVKVGTTGRVGADVRLPTGTPSTAGFWAYLGKALKLPGDPFGANPHALVL